VKRNFGSGVEHFIRGVREILGGGGVKPPNHPVNPPMVAIPHVDIMCEIDFTYENFTREVFPFHIWISLLLRLKHSVILTGPQGRTV
jgi:hypothetical protein